MKLFLVCFILLSCGSHDLFVRGERSNRGRPIKIIKTSHGDIFDCVDIYQQPAFDHPLLKDHKILTQPKVQFKNFREEHGGAANGNNRTINLELGGGGCPDGTVPIQRLPENNLTGPSTSPNYAHHPNDKASSGYFGLYATRRTKLTRWSKYHGASSMVNVYGVNPVSPTQLSGAMIWLMNHEVADISKPPYIQAGWMVSPDYYGDDNTRLTIAWNWVFNGCINLQCPGFVQTNSKIPLGARISPLSTVGGDQYYVHLHMYGDEANNWWFAFDDLKNTIGYWPEKILGSFGHATEAQFGGFVWCKRGQVCPPMGSGRKPETSLAATMEQVQVIGRDHKWGGLGSFMSLPWLTKKACYPIGSYQHVAHAYKFLFGGPACSNTNSSDPPARPLL